MKNIDTLSLVELKELLTGLHAYKDMKRKLGKRGENLFKRNLNAQNHFVVEYFSSISEDLAFANASSIYKKSFGVEPKREDIEFHKVDHISGGIKVYMNDNMVDMSYSKIKKALKS